MYTPYPRDRERFQYHFNWQYERPVQVLPTLREMFFLTDMRMPEYAGFVGFNNVHVKSDLNLILNVDA